MAESFGHPLSTSTVSPKPEINVQAQPASAIALKPSPVIPTQTPQHLHFVNIPLQPSTNTNVNILQQLNLPPLPALPATTPITTAMATPSAPAVPTAPTPVLPAVVPPVIPAAFQGVQPAATPMTRLQQQMQAKLNPSAPSFTPNPCTNIPPPQPQETSKENTESTNKTNATATGSVQGSPPTTMVSSQIEQLKQKVQESLNKIQFLALQLNTLQMLNQHSQTLQTVQQYQTVYQQYQIELANTVLLNQYITNLNQMASLQKLQTEQQPQPQPTTNTSTATATKAKSPSPPPAAAVNKLETIEEGEEEEMEDGDDIAAPAPVSNGDQDQTQGPDEEDEGNEEMKEEQLETYASSAVGEAVDMLETAGGNFLKFPSSLYEAAETDTTGTVEIGERAVNLNKSPSDLAKIKKQIRGILNKITPENFDKLSQTISSILKLADIADQHDKENREPLSGEQLRAAQKAQFKALIRLILKCILEKAIIEPIFSNQYARLCYSLYLYAESNEMKKKVFRLQLISLCHNVFNRARNSAESARFIGIITMIGELFTYGLISWRVINAGIFEELLPPSQALDIEAVCKLLKTSGHEFDKHHYQEINQVIESLSNHAQNFDFRTQCFVKEISEMRKNDWKQRKDIKPESPKPLSQIHREFHQEKTAEKLDIEAVCKLLKTSGHEFDKHHYQEINQVIESLSNHAQNFDFRTQCFVKEISEMRKNDWKQRKDIKPESPKPLSQIHREFHQEKTARKVVPTPVHSSYRSVPRNQTESNSSFTRPQRYINNNHVSHYQRATSPSPSSSYHGGARNNYNGGNRWRNGYNSRYQHNNGNSYGGQYNRFNNNAYPQRKRAKSLRPTVEFVKDVTLPDRSHYPGNKMLTKTWAMRNSGELPWGDDVELVYFKGDESLSMQSRYPVMNAQPGQEVQLSANIRTPRTPGRYCTYFRLQKNGKFFGPRVWVDIIVSDPAASSQPDGHSEITKQCAVSSQRNDNNHQQAGVGVRCQ
eukprot:CAMPEP_0197077480 /NCGR_PEP_ID=MMETSP1384-20130603/212634_1 /TAXON_ID=29189 /ORGANISM="Ammonia sp." /LENGTH=993 /DNA_ID=CAMNT_0042516345 /DNA_START=184 /DNA_END=3166 /DNA_ORIENTATION=+